MDEALIQDRVIPWARWQKEFSGMSLGAAKRAKAAGEGPRLIRLSEKRHGVTVRSHRKWLKSRETLH
jgi:hypothetical protein